MTDRMLLNAIDTGNGVDSGTGDGGRTALLLHGLMGSAESWRRVIPVLAGRGYRVLALDLPGHGRSPRDPDLTVAKAAASVVETVRALAPESIRASVNILDSTSPLHAIGHSYGATVLAAAAAQLRPATAVYVDAVPRIVGGQDRAALTAQYARDRRARTSPAWLRETRPYYSEKDAEVEARAAESFDPATSASLSAHPDAEWRLGPGDIVVRAEPSTWVTDTDAREFEARGVDVRSIRGAAHTVWYSHFEEFTASVPEMFAPR